MEGEVFVDAAESGDEMIFEPAHRSFGCIAPMKSDGNEVIVDALVNEELFERNGSFVVEVL